MDRIFLAVWGGQAVSLLLSGATTIAVSLWVFDNTASAFALSVVIALKFAITIYFAPIAGAIADRYQRKRLIITTNVALAAVSSVVAVVIIVADDPWLGLVLALFAISGFADSVLVTALTASIRDIQREGDLTRLSGVISVFETSPTIVAPILGAVLFASFGIHVVLIADAATFLLSAGVAAIVRWPSVDESASTPHALWKGAAAGVRLVWASAAYRRLQIGNAAGNFANGLAAAGLSTFILVSAMGGATVLGAFNSASALGLVVGAGIVALWGAQLNRGASIASGLTVAAVAGRVAVGLTTFPTAWILGGMVRALCVQLANAPLTAIWLEATPRHHQGKVFGARRLLGQGTFPIAVVLGGSIAEYIGSDNAKGIGLWLVCLGLLELAIVGALAVSGVFRTVGRRPVPLLTDTRDISTGASRPPAA